GGGGGRMGRGSKCCEGETWWAPRAHIESCRSTTTPARRAAPRRSPLPARRLRRAIQDPPKRRVNRIASQTRSAARAPALRWSGTSRKDVDHGPIQRKETGRPRYAAASTRMVKPGRSGGGPSQPAREAAYTGGPP